MSESEININSNPFNDQEISETYESWYLTDGQAADFKEKALLRWLLERFSRAQTILEVGCGTGHFTRWFGDLSLHTVGLEISQPMLLEAKRLGTPMCLRGDAELLPFPSKSFDLLTLITALEFLPDPHLVLTEAMRVARQGLILGVLNAESKLGREYKNSGGPIWKVARFYTPKELTKMVLTINEKVEIIWRTTLWPFWPGALPLPFGGFIGMAVKYIE